MTVAGSCFEFSLLFPAVTILLLPMSVSLLQLSSSSASLEGHSEALQHVPTAWGTCAWSPHLQVAVTWLEAGHQPSVIQGISSLCSHHEGLDWLERGFRHLHVFWKNLGLASSPFSCPLWLVESHWAVWSPAAPCEGWLEGRWQSSPDLCITFSEVVKVVHVPYKRKRGRLPVPDSIQIWIK